MRIRPLFLAALLSSTCLSSPAQAEPVSMFIGGMMAGLSTGVVAAAGIGGAYAAGMTAGAWLVGGSFLSQMVISIGLSALAQGLAPKPVMPPVPEVQSNYAQAMAWMERVYGRVRKGGPFCFSAMSSVGFNNHRGWDGRRKRHYGVLIAAHQTKGPVIHYLDKWGVELNETGQVTTPPVRYAKHSALLPTDFFCWIRPYTGRSGQAADPIWRSCFSEVSASDTFAGLSYAALYAAKPDQWYFQELYPTSREWVYAPVWDGCDTIYDPRSATTGYSNNAALVIADAAVWYGKEVDWAEVAAEADICDQLVTNRSGSTQKRWTINTVLRSNMTWEEVRAHLMMCCDAWFYERADGKIGFKVGYYAAPTVTLSDSDFTALNLKHKAQGPDQIGSYTLRYIEPDRDWSEEVSGAVVIDPATDQRAEESCSGIDSHNQAWRVIRRWASAANAEWQVSGTLKAIGYELIGQRFVRLVNQEIGLDCMLEVARLSRIAGSHQFSLEAASIEAGDFSPNALIDEPPRPLRAGVDEADTIPAIAALTGAVINGSGGSATLNWMWPAQSPEYSQQIRIRAAAAGITDWQIVGIASGQSSYILTGLIDGVTYEAQVRNRTGGGRVGLWGPDTALAVQAVANTTPPPAMGGFTGVASNSQVSLTFISPNSPLYSAARIYRATDRVRFEDAALVGTEFGAPNLTDQWTDPAPGAGTHSYWIEPINGSGIAGPKTGRLTFTII